MAALDGVPDAAALRRSLYEEGAPSRADLAGLLALGPRAGDDPAFLGLVADVAADALVREADPPGYLSEADADWLTAHLGDGAGLTCRAEFAALMSVLTHAVSAPRALSAFGLREAEREILTGHRIGLGGEGEAGVVGARDVEVLRAICFAPNAGAPLHVDRAAAEALFDIAHATATARNDPAFPDFFAKAVGDYLIGSVFVAPPSRAEALAHDAPLAGFGAFLKGLVGGFSPRAAVDEMKSVDQLAEDRYFEENAETEARLEAAARIDAGEAKWILAHLARGELSPAEKRLLAFLRDEAAGAPPEIAALFDRAA